MRWLWVMLALGGCRTLSPRVDSGFPATQLVVDFPRADEGILKFDVRVPLAAADVRAVTWELFVSGRRLATGLEGAAKSERVGNEVVVHVDAPLVFHHRAYTEGPAYLQVRVKGEVQAGPGPERFGFFGRAEVLAHGAPDLGDELEDRP